MTAGLYLSLSMRPARRISESLTRPSFGPCMQGLVSAFASVGRYFCLRAGRDYLFNNDKNLLGAKLGDDDEVTASWIREEGHIMSLRDDVERARGWQPAVAVPPAGADRKGSAVSPSVPSHSGPPLSGSPWVNKLREEGRQAESWVLYHHEPKLWVRLFEVMADLLRVRAEAQKGELPSEAAIVAILPVEFRPHISEAQAATAQHPGSWAGVRRFLLDNLEPKRMLALGVPRGRMGPYGELLSAIDGPFGRVMEEAICRIKDWAIAYQHE